MVNYNSRSSNKIIQILSLKGRFMEVSKHTTFTVDKLIQLLHLSQKDAGLGGAIKITVIFINGRY